MKARAALALEALLVGAALAASGPAWASGFHVDELDGAATGRAGAVIAHATNASTIYYNPAGMAELHGLQLRLGAAAVRPTAEFTPAAGGEKTKADPDTFVLPALFASWRASAQVALGIGLYSPFGLALDWPASSPGAASVRQAELQTFFITAAWALNLSQWVPGLSVGAGMDLVPAQVRLTRDIPFGTDVGSAALSGSAFGLGGRAGLSYRPSALPALSLGLTYRSPVLLKFRGDADFDAPPAYRGSLPPDGDVRTSVTLPQMLVFGVSVAPVPEWDIEIDATWRGWSSYDRLDIVLPDGQVQSSRKDWNDSYTLRLGTEYTFDQRWSARLGAIWDQTPIPTSTLDFQLPDADRIDFSAGFGAQITPLVRADLGALYVLPVRATTSMADPLAPPVKGTFRIDAWVVGLNVGFQLDVPEAPPLESDEREPPEYGEESPGPRSIEALPQP
ncbi:MAG TPA: outer membrane protein transport protein [Polyangiaceae bacterium]|jgi:long-chain fatty acid transport protein|nr:outer membrane protein transport protein [Polyangiaceae bacterium]